MSVYLMCLYGHEPLKQWFAAEWKKRGKKLDMGKSCIRFKKIDDLALDVLAAAIRRVPSEVYIKYIEAALAQSKGKPRTSSRKNTGENSPRASKVVATKPAKAQSAAEGKKVVKVKGQNTAATRAASSPVAKPIGKPIGKPVAKSNAKSRAKPASR
jgi:hypothetical protein